MEVKDIEAGARLILEDGSVVRVIEPARGGDAVRVVYLESPFDPKLVGTEGSCTNYDIMGFAEREELGSAKS
jgi:hypothetical protein